MITLKGFGVNWQTALLGLLLAALAATTWTIAAPVVQPGEPSSQASAAVAPCRPGQWVTRSVHNDHGFINWRAYVNARVQANGCDVRLATDSLQCTHWGVMATVEFDWCGAYRRNTETAYGQTLTIGARAHVYVAWKGAPISSPFHLCQTYNRWGKLIRQWNGPYGSSC